MKLFKNTQSGRSLLSKCGVDEQIFLSDVYKKRTQSKKYQSDAPQFGRSMVEMLGVLAIIGVLSVGGIAGYSKAMYKHKMNKTIDTTSHILMGLTQLISMNADTTDFDNQTALKLGILDESLCTSGKCMLPTGGELRLHNGWLEVVFYEENRVNLCIDFLSNHWENMLPDGIQHISPLTYNGNFSYLYAPNGYGGSVKKSYGLSDIQEACKKSCDNDYFCYIYIMINPDS